MTDPTKTDPTKGNDAGAAEARAKEEAAVAKAKDETAAKAKAEKPAKPAKAAAASTIVVTGPEKGRWRIGRKFTREPVSIVPDALKEGDLEKLQADPELHVQIIDAPY